MRLLLISANRERIPDPIFPLGTAYVAAAARRAGHEVTVVDLCFERHPLRRLAREVARVRPHAVALALRNMDNAACPRTVDYLPDHLRAAPAVTSFLIPFLCRQAAEAGNWVLPGVVPPPLPASQRLLRALGVSGPLWRLLGSRLFRAASRLKYRRPLTSAGVPTPRRLIP